MGYKIEELAIKLRRAEQDLASCDSKLIEARVRLEQARIELGEAVDEEIIRRQDAME